MKDKKIYWAIYLILAASIILLNALEIFPAKLSLWNLIISVLLGGIVGSLISLNFYGVFIPLSVIGILYKTIISGSALLDYGTATIGDLRGARNLKYNGSIYNFVLYSELLDQNAITQN